MIDIDLENLTFDVIERRPQISSMPKDKGIMKAKVLLLHYFFLHTLPPYLTLQVCINLVRYNFNASLAQKP